MTEESKPAIEELTEMCNKAVVSMIENGFTRHIQYFSGDGELIGEEKIPMVSIELVDPREASDDPKVQHLMRHILLHNMLDELVADFIENTEGLPSRTSVADLMFWSFEQTKNPVSKKDVF